jgi:alginate O-acetyltransferase complex protein AlgI
MLFNSWEFLILLGITFAAYYAPWSAGRHGKAWQVTIALLASVIFYGWEDPRLLGLLAVSCVGNSIATARIILHKVNGDEVRVRRWVRLAVILNLALLGIFKYAPFLGGMLGGLPPSWVAMLKAIPLPIGISFYTFHGISMIVDVARGEVTRESDAMVSKGTRFAKGVRDIGFYLLFFPQLVAGPIVKAKQFWPQIASKRLADVDWRKVVRSLIIGYFLKMVVADNLAEQTVTLTKPWITMASGADLAFLLYGYSLQIFADFAGYSLIAIGLAAMFGYTFPINFNFPYLSTSITEFWRRWHMSLSAWLRDYLYIPLGGNRKGEARTYLNLFLVMFLGGLWHGAEWKFALWGTLHGLLLGIERFCFRKLTREQAAQPRSLLRAVLGWAYTFHAVTLLWLTFLMPDLHQIELYLKGLLAPGKPVGPVVFGVTIFGSAAILYHVLGWVAEHRKEWLTRFKTSGLEAVALGVMLFLTLTNSGAPQGFIYFQF